MQKLIEVKNLTISANKKPVVKGISFEVGEGEVLAILGPSGSGKSLLLYSIAGLADKIPGIEIFGSVKLKGKDVMGLSSEERVENFGIVLQDPEAQFIACRVKDEIAFPLENLFYSDREINSFIDKALNLFGMVELKNRPIWELSSGQKQKLALASMFAMNPKIILLDNPTAQLDPKSSKELYDYFRDLKNSGKTMVLTEYKWKRASGIADKALILNEKGEGIAYGSVNKVYEGLKDEGLERFGIKPSRVLKGKFGCPSTLTDVLTVEKLFFSYDGKKLVLKNINIHAKEGEVIAIVGPNGSGKTTLGKLIAGVLKPTKGMIKINAPESFSTSMLFQNPSIQIAGKTPREDIGLSLRLKNKGFEGETLKIAEEFGISDFLDTPIFELSFGKRKLLAIASILAIDSKIFIFDEPTVGFDWSIAKTLREKIISFSKRGHVIVLLTHDLEFVSTLTDNVIVILDGEVAYEGSLEKLLSNKLLLKKFNLFGPEEENGHDNR
ncbi:MAG: ATP-binding cassette domain-containing protein [Candidatus Bathyarchaeia archaeon]